MATIATTTVETVAIPPTHSSPELDQLNDLPKPLRRSTTIQNPSPGMGHRQRHSKKMSLNFPVLVPVPHDSPLQTNGPLSSHSPSPTVISPYHNRYGGITPLTTYPFPLPSPEEEVTDSPDFLTLIAGQERRVMELKEELSKAESELVGLKKQWSMFEAKKKHAELRSKTVKLGPISPKDKLVTLDAGAEEAERTKRREAREKKLKEMSAKDGDIARSNSTGGKRKVITGRHARTLSLLQNNALPVGNTTPTRPKSKTESSPSANQSQQSGRTASTSTTGNPAPDSSSISRPSLSRQPTLQELITSSATGAAQMNLGKTYKDLAQASRQSLPPGTDDLVKQGKQVYDGVSAGFWNFVEDIRQATVGDEAVNGVSSEQQQQRQAAARKASKKLGAQGNEKQSKGGKMGKTGDNHEPEKDNFWKEFGIEPPKPVKKTNSGDSKKASGKENTAPAKEHESKSSTSSQAPSLLVDLMDVNEDDEAWDNWPADSPVARRQAEQRIKVRSVSDDGYTDRDSMSSQMGAGKAFTSKNHEADMQASWTDLTT